MTRLIAVIAVLAIAATFGAVTVQTARADDMCPDHMGTTIESLHHCVQHAHEAGHIDNAGVARSLLAKVNAALAAHDRGQDTVAIHHLEAFINAVEAQSGQHIDPEHAEHMIEHAERVIEALGD